MNNMKCNFKSQETRITIIRVGEVGDTFYVWKYLFVLMLE